MNLGHNVLKYLSEVIVGVRACVCVRVCVCSCVSVAGRMWEGGWG